jgi:hypothetical protein
MPKPHIAILVAVLVVCCLGSATLIFVGTLTIDNARRLNALETKLEKAAETDRRVIKALYLIGDAVDDLRKDENLAPLPAPVLPIPPTPSEQLLLLKFQPTRCQEAQQ